MQLYSQSGHAAVELNRPLERRRTSQRPGLDRGQRRVTETGPGEIFFRSLGYPYRGRMTDSAAVLVFLPYELTRDAPLLQIAHNIALSGSLAELLVSYRRPGRSILGRRSAIG